MPVNRQLTSIETEFVDKLEGEYKILPGQDRQDRSLSVHNQRVVDHGYPCSRFCQCFHSQHSRLVVAGLTASFLFDLADVEYCVDVTITEIVSKKLVAGYDDPRKPPTLSEIFQELFGEEDSLTKLVEEFEELISGYDDHVHIDDLQQADNVMREIVKEIEDRSKD